MDPLNPFAQGPQAGAESQDGNTQATPTPEVPAQVPAQADPNAGIQKRIDELVGRFHESQRANQQLMDMNQQLLMQMQQGQKVQAQEPAFDIDPEEQRKLDYIIGRATAPLQKRIEELTGSFMGGQVQQAAQAHKAVLAKVNSPEVVERYDALISKWQREGQLRSGVATPDDALRIAAGEFFLGQLGKSEKSRDELGRFNAQGGVVGQQSGPRAPSTGRQVDPDSLSLDEQVAYYEAKTNGQQF